MVRKREDLRRHLFLLLLAVVINQVTYALLSLDQYRTLAPGRLPGELLEDFLENLFETVVLAELSFLYCRLAVRLFRRARKTFANLTLQCLLIFVFNVVTAYTFARIYYLIYPEDAFLAARVLISDSFVVTFLSTIYLVSNLTRLYHEEHLLALRSRLDKVAIQADNHFIFNSMATLIALIKRDRDKAVDFVACFSGIYRYLVRKTDSPLVSLQDELGFVRSYMKLIHYRFEDGIAAEIDPALGDVIAYICPVSLQIAVENAIAHNAHSAARPLVIRIFRDGDRIRVENERRKLVSEHRGTGTGLDNLSERCLLTTGRAVEILDDGVTYSVAIPILSEIPVPADPGAGFRF